jgi:uncharacterized membrane protein
MNPQEDPNNTTATQTPPAPAPAPTTDQPAPAAAPTPPPAAPVQGSAPVTAGKKKSMTKWLIVAGVVVVALVVIWYLFLK